MEDPDPALFLLENLPALSSVFLPLTPTIIVGFGGMLVLLFFSAMISGSETAFFSLGPATVEELRNDESGNARLVAGILERPKRLLATILIANNFVNVAIVILSTFVTLRLFNFETYPLLGFVIQVIVVTALILLLGEIMPKVYATQQARAFATTMAPVLRVLIRAFYPMGSLLIRSTRIIDRRFARKGHNLSMSELSEAIEITSDDETAEEDKKILKGIVKFGDIDVKEIMKSRVDVTAVDTALDFPSLLNLILDSGYSRIPAFEENFDKIAGILYIKDLLPYLGREEDFDWQELLRPAFFVPENKLINELLTEFQEKKIHMAIVVDEYGGTSGIVTLEDIIEEIVGEISDEFDVEADDLLHRRISENTWVFEGKASLNDFCKILEIDDRIFEKVKGESDTLAGLILELEGKIPGKNTEVNFPPFVFRIESADPRRIHKIRVTRKEEVDDEE